MVVCEYTASVCLEYSKFYSLITVNLLLLINNISIKFKYGEFYVVNSVINC